MNEREGGSEVQARSQDTGLVALVVVSQSGTQLLRKEKDEASLCRVCEKGFPECLHSPILRGLKVFYLCGGWGEAALLPSVTPSNFALVSQLKLVR